MNNKQLSFQKLTPSDDIDIKNYKNAFDFIFKNSDIKNIAISGAYGAGKSSVLASYKKKRNDINFIHISLAEYNPVDKKKVPEFTTNSILEGKILNQLIHQIPSKDIPQTNFRIKKKINKKSIIIETIYIVMFLISFAYLIFFNSWAKSIHSLGDSFLDFTISSRYIFILPILIVIIFIGYNIFRLIKIQKEKNIFRKFNFRGNEIEIFEESKDSYFDKYLNEVLYLFDKTKADVIVFEDLDRFNVYTIFERLKEVNILVNLQRDKEEAKPLRFFYLLKDDIFTSKDRTKFFDFIIPIIPVLDTSNSYDQLVALLKKENFFNKFSPVFLQEISLYIDDMRTLKNIYNEFIIYNKNINNIELDFDNMLSIITYKNLFPRDFSKLQLNRGFIHSLFSNKEVFMKDRIDKLRYEISKNKDEIALLDTKDDKNAIDNLKTEIKESENKIVDFKNLQLNKMITRDNIDTIFNLTSNEQIKQENIFKDVQDSNYFDLLKYLIRSGYIDESYSDYMSLFHAGALSIGDKNFLRSITDKRSKQYAYKLSDTEQVIKRLNSRSFDQKEILNYDILNYLLNNNDASFYYALLKRFISQLKETKNFKFIFNYLNSHDDVCKFVILMNKLWPEILSAAIFDDTLTKKELHLYLCYTIYFSDDYILKKMNEDNPLTNYISNTPEFLDIKEPQVNKLINGFSILNIIFKDISYSKHNKELLESVCKNNLYEINFENLSLILKEVHHVTNEKDIVHKNYTLINQLNNSHILDYVTQNIDIYMNVILSNCKDKITDEEHTALILLNNKDISEQHKNDYINYLETKINSIIDIDDRDNMDRLLDRQLVVYSENNIITYYDNYGLTKTIIDFINNNEIRLDFDRNSAQFDENIANNFFGEVILCNSIKDNKYEDILTTLKFHYESMIDVSNLDSNKFKILVNNKILPMTLKGLEFVRKFFPEQINCYIKKNIEKYADIMTPGMFKINELLEILSSKIDDDIKLKLLPFTNQKISILGKNYTLQVNNYIMQKNLNTEEIPTLFTSYENWDLTLQKIIKKLAISHSDYIQSNPEKISKKLIIDIFNFQEVDDNIKLKILLSLIPKTNELTVKKYLDLLKLENYSNLFIPHARTKFKVDPFNNDMLKLFRAKGWIREFSLNKNDGNFYSVKKRRIKK